MDHSTFLRSMPADRLTHLRSRSTAIGLRRFALHLGLILAFGTLVTLRLPGWWLLMLPQGILIAFLFTLQHEATHKTPFASEPLNEWVGWFCGLMILQPFLWFRYFHLAHHRHTQDPEHDPELTGLPKPEDWPAMLWHLGCLGYWRDKLFLIAENALGLVDAPYVPERLHPRLRREALGMIAVYTAALTFSILVHPALLWAWLVPLMLGFPVLRFYLLAEHGRCPFVADMFDNTRTTYTNAVVRFLAWNMPYHSEHHALPQVPFFRLPEFHADIRGHLRTTSPGYRAFGQAYVATLEPAKTANTKR